IARDAAGNRTTSTAISVTVNNVVPDTTPPSVSITAPAIGATVSGSNFTDSATTSHNFGDGPIQSLLDRASFVIEVTTSPYSVFWNTLLFFPTRRSSDLIARDAAGNRTTSTAISVTVNNLVPDTTPPSVSITAPANGVTVSGSNF